MPAPVPQTIAPEISVHIKELGMMPEHNRDEVAYQRLKREIRQKLNKLAKVDLPLSYSLEMQFASVLLDREATENFYQKAKGEFLELRELDYNFAVSLAYLGDFQAAVDCLLLTRTPHEKEIFVASFYFLKTGQFEKAAEVAGKLDSRVRIDEVMTAENYQRELEKLVNFVRQYPNLKDGVQSLFSVINDFIRKQGLFFDQTRIHLQSDESSSWITYKVSTNQELEKVLDLNDQLIETLIDSEIDPKVQSLVCPIIVKG